MNIIHIFSTPIWNSEFPEFENQKQTFLKAVTEFREQNPQGIDKSNIVGYQSPMNLTNEPRHFNDSRAACNHEHIHSDTYAGVFYLQVPEKSGMISFANSGLNTLWQGTMLSESKNKFTAERIKFEPKEGQIYIWPAYLPHSVMPNDHDEARISISFNIICIPKEQVSSTK